MTVRAEQRIATLERLVLELEGEVRALSRDCLLAYRERDHARTFACQLITGYESVTGPPWPPDMVRLAAQDLDIRGVALITGPRGNWP